MVCKVEESLVWLEQRYISDAFRRQGLASLLFEKAEELSRLLGGETLFNYVHPNNHEMLAFLKHQGYTVLNLIEVRKLSKDEQLSRVAHMDDELFDY